MAWVCRFIITWSPPVPPSTPMRTKGSTIGLALGSIEQTITLSEGPPIRDVSCVLGLVAGTSCFRA